MSCKALQGQMTKASNFGGFVSLTSFRDSEVLKYLSKKFQDFSKEHPITCLELSNSARGHGGRASEGGVWFPAQPQVGKLVVACHWLAVYSAEP